ncbi:LacI family transcriptional regulator [Clostridiaceae bacterium WCA-383-APC-5B]|uniref:LacI family transcriptional regulator n=2 Tax=Inconstantimicrobium porci TaxID=2652291 RepID=A0A7X2MYG3_9CLOT|nr:LacI family transcriptional regulator [Inconstantimicrobium porci]
MFYIINNLIYRRKLLMNNLEKTTIKDVAKEAGVSTATVSYVINNLDKIKPDTRERVLAAIKKLNYTPNSAARSLAKKEAKQIALIMPFEDKSKRSILTENPFFQEFIGGVQYKCSETGYNATILGIDNEQRFSELINSGDLTGIIVLGYIGENNYRLLSKLNLPTILVDQERNENCFTNLLADDENGGLIGAEYLINNGHTKIGFAAGNFWSTPIYQYRFNGFRKALSLHNINFNPALIFQDEISYDDGFKLASKIKDNLDNMTALFCASDILALGIIKGLHSLGINVPEDISIIGFDNIKHSQFFIPGLTTINQDIFSKGEKAVDIIINKVSSSEKLQNETIISNVSLVERESVKKG